MLRLMDQKSGDHQLRLVVYSIIYKVLVPSQVVQDFLHQQNDGSLSHTNILSIMSCLSFRFVLDSVPVKNYHSITHSHPYDSLHHQSPIKLIRFSAHQEQQRVFRVFRLKNTFVSQDVATNPSCCDVLSDSLAMAWYKRK